MRIAFVGGSPGHYDEVALTDFLQRVRGKYPDATWVTGSAKGGEAQVREFAELTDMNLVVPSLLDEKYVNDPMILQVNNITPEADVIVCIGTPTGARAKVAHELWHRLNMHKRDVRGGLVKVKGQYVSQREPHNQQTLHVIATKKKVK